MTKARLTLNAEALDVQQQAIVDAVSALLKPLQPKDQETILRRLVTLHRPIEAPKAGEALGAVIRLIPRDRNWTVEEIRHDVAKANSEISAKEIYNAISYLNRRGQIQKVGHGRYIVGGVAVVTSDELSGEESPDE